MTKYQVNVAAEAFVVVALSQCGYDVAMQYGTTQPDWDILATKGGRTLKVQVKGSQDGAWGLFQSHLQNADYHGALIAWAAKQLPDIVYVFVQFENVVAGHTPRCYAARPTEIIEHMKTARAGHAETILHENHAYTRGIGAGHTDVIPAAWALNEGRVDSV